MEKLAEIFNNVCLFLDGQHPVMVFLLLVMLACVFVALSWLVEALFGRRDG